VEQIIAKLREVEKLTAQGMSVPLAARKVGVTDQTFYRWRIRERRRPTGPLEGPAVEEAPLVLVA
jgi:transposase-like protein